MEKIKNSLWELPEMSGKFPSHTGQFRNSYDPGRFTDEELIARESTQNTLDANLGVKGIAELEFYDLQISARDKLELIELFGLGDLLKPRIETFKNKGNRNLFSKKLEEFFHPECAMSALLIRDQKTCGLGGAWDKYEPNDHFGRLVTGIHYDDKGSEDLHDKTSAKHNYGGSYGLGKTVFAKSSHIKTVLYHSTFARTDRTEGINRRLMVTGIYPEHKFQDTHYAGYAFFGEKTIQKNMPCAKPFGNEEALSIWEKVESLFDLNACRGENDHGTDTLIFMSNLDIQKIQTAIEDYYFPAIIDGKLSVKFFQSARSAPSFHNIDVRPDLSQFRRLYMDVTQDRSDRSDSSETRKVGKLNPFEKLNLGTYGFEAASPEISEDKLNCVALLRGTGMVINYEKFSSDLNSPAVGVFSAHDDVKEYLKLSENHSHSTWNARNERLAQKYLDQGPNVVESLNRRLKDNFRRFQKNLQPNTNEVLIAERSNLEKIFSKIFSGKSGAARPPRGDPNPVGLSLIQDKREQTSSIWTLVVSSNEHTPESSFQLKIEPFVEIADEDMHGIQRKTLTVVDSSSETTTTGTAPILHRSFSKGDEIKLVLSHDQPGWMNYRVRCKFSVEKEK